MNRYTVILLGILSVVQGGCGNSAVVRTPSTVLTVNFDPNCDGEFNTADASAFALALSNPTSYQSNFPGCDGENLDFNCDGMVNLNDIAGIHQFLTNPYAYDSYLLAFPACSDGIEPELFELE